jgi:hypothetical protein
MAKTHGFHKVVRASACSHTLKTANIKSCYDPRSRLWYYKAYNRAFWGPTTHKSSYKRASKKGNVSWRPISTLTNLKANYPLRIIVLIKLITPLFTVSCCNDKQLGFDLHSTALAIVSIINFHSFFDVLCQTVYCVTVTYCVQVSSGKLFLSHLKLSATFNVLTFYFQPAA